MHILFTYILYMFQFHGVSVWDEILLPRQMHFWPVSLLVLVVDMMFGQKDMYT